MLASTKFIPWLMAGAAIGLAVAGFSPVSRGTAAVGDEPPAGGPVRTTKKASAKAATAAVSPEEQEIRNGSAAFAKAFNSHDAKAVAALFAIKAEFVDEAGNTIKGRDAIEKNYAELFLAKPKAAIEVHVGSIRMLTPHIAIEEGTVRTTPAPDEAASTSSYLAVNVKVDGKWLVGTVKNVDAPAGAGTPHDHLQELAWMVGEWVDESPDATVKTSCRWTDSGNFLLQQFSVQVAGRAAMNGTMRIGWDPVSKQFRSWVFDSNGGFVEGLWIRDGEEWVVKSQGVTAQGATASSTAVYRPVDHDTFTWRSHDRVVGGERSEDIAEVIIKRQPPLPSR